MSRGEFGAQYEESYACSLTIALVLSVLIVLGR